MLISDSYFILLKNTYTIIRVKDSTSVTCNRINSLSVKKNLDLVFSMNYDFAEVLYSCKSVAHLGSWILNIYIYGKFGVGNVPNLHINRTPANLSTNKSGKKGNVVPLCVQERQAGLTLHSIILPSSPVLRQVVWKIN